MPPVVEVHGHLRVTAMPALSAAALVDAWLGSVLGACVGLLIVLVAVQVLKARGY